MRLFFSIILLVATIAGFALFIVPHYNAVRALRAQAADYNQILDNAKTLARERNRLVEKYNAFDASQLAKLDAMLPTNPQNVALILELDAVATQNGLLLQNVKIDSSENQPAPSARPGTATNNDIGTLSITFTATGPYGGFVNFLQSMERSLRIIDITKVSFTALEDKANYQYTVGIKTYWLK